MCLFFFYIVTIHVLKVNHSSNIPGVRFAGIIHSGLMDCAPSKELLTEWNKREAALVATDSNRVSPLALLPEKKGACAGKLFSEQAEVVMQEGARTVPPREHGGNCDIKNLTRGLKVYFSRLNI